MAISQVWKIFWEQFYSMIRSNDSLDDIKKFSYLLFHLCEDAKNSLQIVNIVKNIDCLVSNSLQIVNIVKNIDCLVSTKMQFRLYC